MAIRGHEVTYPHLLLIAVLLCTLSVATIAVGTSSAAFGPYNYGWNGSSDFRSLAEDSEAEVTVAHSTAAYHPVNDDQTTAFVLGPTDSYTESEAQSVSAFINRGGTVVIAADGSRQTNQLLETIGVDSRFDGRQLRDEQRHHRNPALPYASPVEDSPLTQNGSRLTLNHATVVSPANNGEVLVNSSAFSYLDANANDELDDAEPVRQYPVVVREEHGNGSVILVSDASIFTNAMLDRPANEQFARNVLTDSETVLLDYSHSNGIPTVIVLLQAASDSRVVQWVSGLALIAGAGVAWRVTPSFPHQLDDDSSAETAAPQSEYEATAARIAEQHPEWDADQVERATKSVMRNERE